MEGADAEGVTFADADLRGANLRNAKLCSRGERISCIDLRGADVRGADFRGALICGNGREPRGCEPVDAGTLRAYAKSSLDGAILP
jgi:uncharacterized protein YjbI with pentapeptide repeats